MYKPRTQSKPGQSWFRKNKGADPDTIESEKDVALANSGGFPLQRNLRLNTINTLVICFDTVNSDPVPVHNAVHEITLRQDVSKVTNLGKHAIKVKFYLTPNQ